MAQTNPITNPSPRTRFQETGDNVSKHRAMVDSHEFRRGVDFALMQYQATLGSQAVDMQGAAASHFKLVGAQEFVQTLRLLADPVPKPHIVPQGNLDHDAN